MMQLASFELESAAGAVPAAPEDVSHRRDVPALRICSHQAFISTGLYAFPILTVLDGSN